MTDNYAGAATYTPSHKVTGRHFFYLDVNMSNSEICSAASPVHLRDFDDYDG